MHELIPQQPSLKHDQIALMGFTEWYKRVSAHYLEALDARPKDIVRAFEGRLTLDTMAEAEPLLYQQMLESNRVELWSSENTLQQVS